MKTAISKISWHVRSGIVSTQIAIASFVIGTILLLIRQVNPENPYIYIVGYFYVLLAFLVNAVVLLNLFYHLLTKPRHREFFAIKLLIVLSNLPIAIMYLIIITYSNN